MANKKHIDKYSDDISLINDLFAQAPKHNLHFIDRATEITQQIRVIMDSKKWKAKDLADALGKEQSEISKILSGTHNFTLRTISHIETVLGVNIVQTEVGRQLEFRNRLAEHIKSISNVVNIMHGQKVSSEYLRIVKHTYTKGDGLKKGRLSKKANEPEKYELAS